MCICPDVEKYPGFHYIWDMEEKLSELYSVANRKIRFVRIWGYDGGPLAQVYYYNADGTPGWETFRPVVDFDGGRVSGFGQYDDLSLIRDESGESRWVSVLFGGEERFRIK